MARELAIDGSTTLAGQRNSDSRKTLMVPRDALAALVERRAGRLHRARAVSTPRRGVHGEAISTGAGGFGVGVAPAARRLDVTGDSPRSSAQSSVAFPSSSRACTSAPFARSMRTESRVDAGDAAADISGVSPAWARLPLGLSAVSSSLSDRKLRAQSQKPLAVRVNSRELDLVVDRRLWTVRPWTVDCRPTTA